MFSDQLAVSLTKYFNLFCFVKRVVVGVHFEPEDLYLLHVYLKLFRFAMLTNEYKPEFQLRKSLKGA